MTYTLIAGVGPIPPENPPLQMAPGLRLWSLATVALGALPQGVVIASCDHFGHRPPGAAPEEALPGGATLLRWPGERLGEAVEAALRRGRPRCVVVTTDLVAAEIARRLPPEVPLWVDLYGDPLAEGQLLAARASHDGGLAPLAANMLAILTRADRVSVCGRAHRLAALGQLGMAGRLSAASCHQELVTALPAMACARETSAESGSPLRGAIVGPGDFAVLWSGGFNTWTDTATLAEGLERAMAAEPRLHFVCVGGPIARHSPGPHAEFAARVEQSPHRARFHLLGWRPQREALALAREADVGINIDAVCHEAELGTRTRLLEWAVAGLPIVSTPLSEMTLDLAAAGALWTFPPGDPAGLAERLVELARDPAKCRQTAERARAHVQAHWTPETAGAPLAAWLREPHLAPDRRPSAPAAGTNRLLAWMRALEPALRSDQEPPADLAEQTRRLRQLEGSRLVRLRDFLRRGR